MDGFLINVLKGLFKTRGVEDIYIPHPYLNETHF